MGIYRRVVYRSATLVVEFEMDRRGMREIAHGPELRAAVGVIAAKGKAYAESIAPESTGDYKRSFGVAFSRVTVAGMRRIAARLYNSDPGAGGIEWGKNVGGKRTPAHHTLTHTLAYLGGLPEARGTLPAPAPGAAAPLAKIPTLEQFRAAQARAQARDRRHRKTGGRR